LCIETEIENNFIKQWTCTLSISFAHSVAKKETFVIMPLILSAFNYSNIC